MAHSTLPKLAIFLSTPSARRATDFYYPVFANLGISIHALREEGDCRLECSCHRHCKDFYPRPPRGGRHMGKTHATRQSDFYPRPPRGGRHWEGFNNKYQNQFLSTPSARRATPAMDEVRPQGDISIHALREEGDELTLPVAVDVEISIHALREEGDRLLHL